MGFHIENPEKTEKDPERRRNRGEEVKGLEENWGKEGIPLPGG